MQEIIKLKTELEKELKARKKAEGAVAVWKDRFLQLRSQGDGIIKTLNQRILTLKGQYAGAKAENGHFKIAMGVLGVLTTVLTATLWLTMFS
jgi:hypothetical protein